MKKLSCLVLMLLTREVLACRMEAPLTSELKSTAERVFVGRAVAYSPRPKFDNTITDWRPAVIRFEVDQTIVGPQQKAIEVYWINSTYGEPASLAEFKKKYGERIRVGLVKDRGDREAPKYHDKLWVVQGGCTPPYLIPEK